MVKSLPTSVADSLCKQFAPRPGSTKHLAWSGSKLFDTLMVFLKELLEKIDFEKNQQTTKIMKNYPGGKELINVLLKMLQIFLKEYIKLQVSLREIELQVLPNPRNTLVL